MNHYRKETVMQPTQDHIIKINNRKKLEISGVKEVDSFDNEEFLIETIMGYLIIRGENLQLKNLDVGSGSVIIKGKVYELSYVDEESEGKAKGFFSKIFK